MGQTPPARAARDFAADLYPCRPVSAQRRKLTRTLAADFDARQNSGFYTTNTEVITEQKTAFNTPSERPEWLPRNTPRLHLICRPIRYRRRRHSQNIGRSQ